MTPKNLDTKSLKVSGLLQHGSELIIKLISITRNRTRGDRPLNFLYFSSNYVVSIHQYSDLIFDLITTLFILIPLLYCIDFVKNKPRLPSESMAMQIIIGSKTVTTVLI